MRIDYHRNFLRNFKKRVVNNPALDLKFKERLKLFERDPQNQVLRNHKLAGSKSNYWAFSITGDVRVIYTKNDGLIIFYDIGSHNQVY